MPAPWAQRGWQDQFELGGAAADRVLGPLQSAGDMRHGLARLDHLPQVAVVILAPRAAMALSAG
ncbi:hypothetical protein DAH56_05850 [Sphingomonas koreensis]|nr:hypothetical protein DAH56_05850 [Sphingomonas koreensis]RSY33602.1 hypothetical protein DAH73_11930 [Sphingomonas koreensis]